MNEGRDRYFIQSVAHAADVLRAFSSPREVLRLRDVVARTGHSRNTAFRLLYTLEKAGLKLAGLEKDTVERLRQCLPPASNIYNPVDVLGDALADRYEFALQTVLADPNVHTAIVLLTPQAMTQAVETAQVIARAARGSTDQRARVLPVLRCARPLTQSVKGSSPASGRDGPCHHSITAGRAPMRPSTPLLPTSFTRYSPGSSGRPMRSSTARSASSTVLPVCSYCSITPLSLWHS